MQVMANNEVGWARVAVHYRGCMKQAQSFSSLNSPGKTMRIGGGGVLVNIVAQSAVAEVLKCKAMLSGIPVLQTGQTRVGIKCFVNLVVNLFVAAARFCSISRPRSLDKSTADRTLHNARGTRTYEPALTLHGQKILLRLICLLLSRVSKAREGCRDTDNTKMWVIGMEYVSRSRGPELIEWVRSVMVKPKIFRLIAEYSDCRTIRFPTQNENTLVVFMWDSRSQEYYRKAIGESCTWLRLHVYPRACHG